METSRQIEHAAAAWIARRDAGDWSGDDQQALDDWIAQSIAHRVAFVRLDAAWKQAEKLKVLGASQAGGRAPSADELMRSPYFGRKAASRRRSAAPGTNPPAAVSPVDLRNLPARRRQRAESAFLRSFAGIAATLVLAGGLIFGLDYWTRAEKASYATTVGGISTVKLSDGSSAVLNTDSKLEVRLSRRQRDIGLDRGEAFFSVAKDASRPFVVHVDGRRVIAVGTQFSVRRDADGMRVVVTEGVVRLETASSALSEQVNLPAGFVAWIGPRGLSVRPGTVEAASRFLSWRQGYLVFADTTLAEAADEFNRYNTTKLRVADATVAQMRIDGNFRYGNVEAFVRLLEQAFPIRARREGELVILESIQ